MSLAPITFEDAAARAWEVVVVGAGPAGALAARETARRGLSVLLVDKAPFPRRKVCGCCINLRALSVLNAAGLGRLPEVHGARPLHGLHLSVAGHVARLPLPGGVSLSRSTLDAALVAAAQQAGTAFLPETAAALGESGADRRAVELRRGDTTRRISVRVVLAADGLAGRLLKEEGFDSPASKGSRVGAGVIVEGAPEDYGDGIIYMACAPGGYVGLVRLEDARLNVAAAFEPGLIKSSGGMGAAAAGLLRQAGFSAVEGLESLPWRGTPALTRRATRVAAPRAFVLGDAAGYVEPFTGEGMAWAMSSAMAVAPLVERMVRGDESTLELEWRRVHRRLVGERQAVCRLTSAVLRRPHLVRVAIAVLNTFPGAASPFVHRINAPFHQRGLASP